MYTSKDISEELSIYREMHEHLDDIVFSHDAQGRMIYVSLSWQQKRLILFDSSRKEQKRILTWDKIKCY